MGTGGTTQGAGMEVRPLLPHDGRAYADLRVLELEEHVSALPLPRLQAELECLALGPDDVIRNYVTSGTIVWGVFDRLTQIGRASCRERLCQYVSISVVAEPLNKKTLQAQIISLMRPKNNK